MDMAQTQWLITELCLSNLFVVISVTEESQVTSGDQKLDSDEDHLVGKKSK